MTTIKKNMIIIWCVNNKIIYKNINNIVIKIENLYLYLTHRPNLFLFLIL